MLSFIKNLRKTVTETHAMLVKLKQAMNKNYV